MRLNINIREIEFEESNRELDYHDRIKISKVFEKELTALLSEGIPQTRNSLIERILPDTIYDTQNLDTKSIKEIDDDKYSVVTGRKNPYLIGKDLASSICSILNLVDIDKTNQ